MKRATTCIVWMATWCALAAPCAPCGAEEPNDSWPTSTILAPGVRSVVDTLFLPEFSFSADTTLGAFGGSKQLIATNDDDSPVGNGLASALFNIPIGGDGVISFAVSGFPDFDFDGLQDGVSGQPHSQMGDYSVVLNIRNSLGGDVGRLEFSGALEPGRADRYFASDPKWSHGVYDAIVDNTASDETDRIDPIDYWAFTELPPGAPYVVEVTEGEFDSLMATFDDVGELIVIDEDSGVGLLSRIEGVVPASGIVYAAVVINEVPPATAEYRLQLFVEIPEPSTMTLLAVGAVVLAAVKANAVS